MRRVVAFHEDITLLKESYLRGRRRMRVPVPPPETNRARINDKIRVPQVLLIDETGAKVGIIQTDEARKRAEVAELDLVEVAANAKPPVCRIMDYGKFLFEEQKKERANAKKSKGQETKEVRLRPGTGQGDLDIKAKHAREFLDAGYKVGIQLQFRGRERAHPEMGIKMIQHFCEMLSDVAKVEQAPRQEGRRMNALIAPLKAPSKKPVKKDDGAKKEKEAKKEAPAEEAPAPAAEEAWRVSCRRLSKRQNRIFALLKKPEA